jgi:hypothetical protein
MSQPEIKVETKPTAAPAAAAPILKKDPTPVFSIPATKSDKDFITKQSDRTGKTQKELLGMAVGASSSKIMALPDYVEPIVEVKVKAPKKVKVVKAAGHKEEPVLITPAMLAAK